MADTFPRQYARTQRLTLGEPRNLTVSPDGRRVVFCRSRHGSDPVNCLWIMDASTGEQRIVADPQALLARPSDETDDVPSEERARRERAREGAGGVVAYATDARVTAAAFALSGRLFIAGLISAQARELTVPGPVFDPRPDPTARRIAYVSGSTLRIAEVNGISWQLAGDDHPDITWGLAEFIAAEEMGRSRGFWWAPDGERLAVTRVDNSMVQHWWIGDPANPASEPTQIAYPSAGTANADVTLHLLSMSGVRVEVIWDRTRFPYLVNVAWTAAALVVLVQARDQRSTQVLRVDPGTGSTTIVAEDRDAAWVEIVPGTPALLGDGRLVMCRDIAGARRLTIDGEAVTPPTMQVRSIVAATEADLVFTANLLQDPTSVHVWRLNAAGSIERLDQDPGVHGAVVGGTTVVLRSTTMGLDGAVTRIIGGPTIPSHAEPPLLKPRVTMLTTGRRALVSAVVLPYDAPSAAKLPVLLDPYGGPHAQRVTSSRGAYLNAQWFADQGFAVVITDGRGTPGRGSAWERSVFGDLASAALEDQVDGLLGVAEKFPQLDLTRVAIRGWSFGGYLAALAVLRRPDVFHAAIAGAPVTDWRLYDTHYTERYLGPPDQLPGNYERTSLIREADKLTRPLMLIHGLADDNVVAAHTLALSAALLAAGRPHQVLPLSGVSHMTPQEIVAENLLLLQLDFLRTSLGLVG